MEDGYEVKAYHVETLQDIHKNKEWYDMVNRWCRDDTKRPFSGVLCKDTTLPFDDTSSYRLYSITDKNRDMFQGFALLKIHNDIDQRVDILDGGDMDILTEVIGRLKDMEHGLSVSVPLTPLHLSFWWNIGFEPLDHALLDLMRHHSTHPDQEFSNEAFTPTEQYEFVWYKEFRPHGYIHHSKN